ncbi:rRNA maturation RNase YbeY [Polynucleobacter kasalickyi]|uniref:Endoribonuclease YbeY n=1 Tax=Polynucleobacter kasalickyi TaxID=1938817 RepID=A0A1W1YND5_9BURK|nr:rRNA maturation RNase YbeY [Polynucleobacter kasalickyi]SMC37642.1 probable rRNA maturation factor [Polynucleobacter kasalickyi]
MPSQKYLVNTQFASTAIQNKWEPLLANAQLKKWIKAACKLPFEFTLRLVNAKEGLALNQAYRDGDHATNILTFSLNDEDSDLTKDTILADFVFCMPVIEKEAKAQGKEVLHHFIHLLVHGVLHAQGFDHEDPIEAEAMEALEIAILHRLKLENPYI